MMHATNSYNQNNIGSALTSGTSSTIIHEEETKEAIFECTICLDTAKEPVVT